MNILLVGSGGREHALAWKIAQSPLVTRLVAAPGNPGIEAVCELRPVKADDAEGLAAGAGATLVGWAVVAMVVLVGWVAAARKTRPSTL